LGGAVVDADANGSSDLLAKLIGDLRPVEPDQAPLLEEARRVVSAALDAGLVPGAGPPASAAATQPSEEPTPAQMLVHRRSVPLSTTGVADAVPAWANGLKATQSLGPFKDPANRDVWLDLFPIVRHVRLVRVAGGVPFLTLPIEVAIRLPERPAPAGSPLKFEIPAGSLWFASQLLDPAAPAGSWTGIQVSAGTISFSGAITSTGEEIVVPAGVTIEVAANTDSETPATGTGPGEDAREANIAVPSQFHLEVASAAKLTVEPSDTARLLAYGFDTTLTPTNATVTYEANLKVLAVALTAAPSPLTVNAVKANAFTLAGSAPITAAAWSLPVAVIEPANLGNASGAGSLLLWLGEGLTGAWPGQPEPVPLTTAILVAAPDSLSLLTGDAQGERIEQQPQLPATEDGSIELRWTPSFDAAFISEAAGVEAVVTEANLNAVLDRPVDLRGEQLSLRADSVAVLLLSTSAGTFLLVEGALAPPSYTNAIGFALVNAMLRVRPPTGIVIYGAYDGTTLQPATVLLAYHLLALDVILPDPYAASYGALRSSLDQEGGNLISVLECQQAESSFGFRLLTGAGAGALRLTATREDPFELDGGANAGADTLALRGVGELEAGAVKAIGDALAFEARRGLMLLDVSTNVDQFGVAWNPASARAANETRFTITGLKFEAEGEDVQLVTLPAVQWEAVETIQDPGPDPLPQWVEFANSGVPTVFSVPTTKLVPVYPTAALNTLVENFAHPQPLASEARFTLPFGMLAVSELRGRTPGEKRSATLTFNRPQQGALEGAHQLRIDAHDSSLSAEQTPALEGFTVQLPVAQPGNRSVLGDTPTDTFNSYLGQASKYRLVPVTRIDLSGYGETLFSDWVNPESLGAEVSQARFDVLIGRTAFEKVELTTTMFPFGAKFMRALVLQRRNNAIITRSDSGWQAVGDGVYEFPESTIVTHPGVVARITNITNILETGQVITVGATEMAAVYFDGDLVLDGAPANPDGTPRLVPAKRQFGFIQVTAGPPISPDQYQELLLQAGPLGGPIDTTINIGSGPQLMRLQRVGVGVTQGMGEPEFAMAGWGAIAFPGGGQWSVAQIEGPLEAPTAVAQDTGLPIIRYGPAGKPPSPSYPYRFADPVDLTQPSNPKRDYALLHGMETQRALFLRPQMEATNPTRITSTEPGSIADPYGLGTATGLYPTPDKAVPFPSSNWALEVSPSGQYKLDLPSPFPAGVGRRTMRQAGSVSSDVDYTAAQITYTLDTSQAVPWQFRLDEAVKIMSSGSLGDLIKLQSNVVSAADIATQFQKPKLELGGALSVVEDLLTILADIGITGTLSTLMTNDWSLKAALKVPFVDATGEPFQIPPLVPNPEIKFDETEAKVELELAPSADKAAFSLAGQPLFGIQSVPDLYVASIIKLEIQISTEAGTVYSLLLGIGLAYEFDAGPFEFKGLFALTFVGFVGDTVLGFGIGFLLELEAELEPIVKVTITLEGQLALVDACRGTGNDTKYGAAKLTFGVEVSVCLVFSISFEVSTTASEVISGPGAPACPLPDVLPNAS
jgi:hypothetical protein